MKKNIGVCCGGGADSSLLLYLLLSNHDGVIHVFTNTFHDNTDKTIQKIINTCIELTGNRNIIHHVSYAKLEKYINLIDLATYYYDLGIISKIYTAVTINPPKEILETFNSKLPDEFLETRSPNITWPENPPGFCLPFRNMNKQKIADVYKRFDLIETLLPLTNSCECNVDLYYDVDKGFNTKDSVKEGHCGKCWWCEERKWGFERYTNKYF